MPTSRAGLSVLLLASACGAESTPRDAQVQGQCEATPAEGHRLGVIEISTDTAAAPCTIGIASTGVTFDTDSMDTWGPVRRVGEEYWGLGTVTDAIGRWSDDGTYLGKFGRRGSGPGEFSYVRGLWVDRFDTIHVSDAGRWHVYAPNLQLARTQSFPLHRWPDVAFLESGELLSSVGSGLPEHASFHVVDRNGNVIRSFGGLSPKGPGASGRRVAYGGGSTFWAVSPTRYDLELWTLDGEQVATLQRKLDWFRGTDDAAGWQPESKTPVILSIVLDEDKLLWVRIYIPPGVEGSPEAARMIEVIDTGSGRLLASRRFANADEFVSGSLGGGRAYIVREDDDGVPTAEIVQVRLATKHK